MQHHISVREPAQFLPAFSILIICHRLKPSMMRTTTTVQLFPRGSPGTLGLPGVGRKTQVRGMEGGGWKSHPPPLFCLWSRVKPRVQLEWSLIFPFQQQLKVWPSVSMVVSHRNDSGSQCWAALMVFIQWNMDLLSSWASMTPFALSPRAGRWARWQLMIGRDHCSALGEWHTCATASPQPFSKCLCRSSHKGGCIDPKMQSKAFESRPYLHHLIRSERASEMHPGKGGDCARGLGLVPSVLARGGDCGQSWVMICHLQDWGVSLCRGNLGRDWQRGRFCRFPRCCQVIMKLCQSIMDMDMPDYVDSLDSSYTMLEFDNLRVLPNNTGEIFIRFLSNNLHYFCYKAGSRGKAGGRCGAKGGRGNI